MGAIIYEKANNPHWPLPPNYYQHPFESEYRRLARINACSMRETPELQVAAWAFFCDYYLKPDDRVGFDPMFYERPVYATPPIHYKMVLAWCKPKPSVHGLPRGHGKSVCGESYILFRICTNRGDSINVYKGTDGHVSDFFDRLKFQLESNERIRADFGNLVPRRGGGLWSNRRIRTNNQVKVRGFSISGQKRGPRSRFSLLDDVERDDEKQVPTDDDFIKIRRAVLKIVLPTLDTPDSAISIVGTTVGRRSFLYHMKGEGLELDRDRRFSDALWSKHFYKASDNLWPTKFSKEFLALRREQMGDALFETEMEGNPLSEEEPLFIIVPAHHEYQIIAEDDATYNSPWESQAKIIYNQTYGPQGKLSSYRVEMGWAAFLNSLFRFATVDYAYTSGPASDWSVVHVMGLDSQGNLFSLDMWADKVDMAGVTDNLWAMAFRYNCAIVGVEAYPIQDAWYELLTILSQNRVSPNGSTPIMQKIIPPPGLEKSKKVARLKSRWNRGQCKLPNHRQYTTPYNMFYDQVRNFTMDLQSLSKDDHLDTFGMAVDVIKGLNMAATPVIAPRTVGDRLLAGESYFPGTKVPLLLGLSPQNPQEASKLTLALQSAYDSDRLSPDENDINDPYDLQGV